MASSSTNKCKNQCGHCCRVTQSPGFWRSADLTDEQIELLLEEQKNYPKGKLRPPSYSGPCEMFADPLCLIHKFLGWEFKPEGCKTYECKRYNNNI